MTQGANLPTSFAMLCCPSKQCSRLCHEGGQKRNLPLTARCAPSFLSRPDALLRSLRVELGHLPFVPFFQSSRFEEAPGRRGKRPGRGLVLLLIAASWKQTAREIAMAATGVMP